MYHGYLQFFTLELLLRCLQFFCYRGRYSSQIVFSLQMQKRRDFLGASDSVYSAFGNNTLKVAPLPSPSDSAQIFPSCTSSNPLAMVSPIPNPP